MSQDFWDKKNVVRAYPDRQCLACNNFYSPNTYWSERCPECKTLNRPKFKKIINTHFNGLKPLPLEKLRTKIIDGVQMPSVTTVLHPQGIDYPEELLIQYSSRGTLVHKQIELFFKLGKWINNPVHLPRAVGKEDPEYDRLKECLRVLEKGSLGLKTTQCNFPGFYKKYGKLFQFNKFEIGVHNKEYKYCGTFDCHGTYKDEPAIIDWKTAANYSSEKVASYFQQLSAYAHTDGIEEKIKYLVVVPLDPKSPNGHGAPLVTRQVKTFFREFLKKREIFTQLYGI